MVNALDHGILDSIASLPVPPDLLNKLRIRLETLLPGTSCPATVLDRLGRFVAAARSPTSLLAFFDRDATTLDSLLRLLGTGEKIADRLIADPESFDLIRASGGAATPREVLVDELAAELEALGRCGADQAALASLVRSVVDRERLRIAYAEFVAGVPTAAIAADLTVLAEAVIEAAVQFSLLGLTRRYGWPRTPSGEAGRIAAIGLGPLGSRELGYGSPLELMFLCDLCGPTDGEENLSSDEFFSLLVNEVVALVSGAADPRRAELGLLYDVSLAKRPLGETGPPVCTVTEAVRYYQSTGRTWERLLHTESRVLAGAPALGERFIELIEPWVYRRYWEAADQEGLQTLVRKQARRIAGGDQPISPGEQRVAASDPSGGSGGPLDVRQRVGGLNDIASVVRLLRLIHAGDAPSVRVPGREATLRALAAAERLTEQQAEDLAGSFAWLARCEHCLHIDAATGAVRNVAWNLGYRDATGQGDEVAFSRGLEESLQTSRQVIGQLLEEPVVGAAEMPLETELLLDPVPDQAAAERMLRSHGMSDPAAAMIDLQRLADEPVPYLSSRRCRHHLAAIAPRLLAEVGAAPAPDQTLKTLAEVSDSLGGKATLWELMGSSPAAMSLFVRLCAGSPYLAGILVRNPGMIDELIDSLVLDRLPSAALLENTSVELCRGAADIRAVMQGFKNGAHLQIGARDLLGKETLEATHESLALTAESILRRTGEWTQRELSDQYGDPIGAGDAPIELVILAAGKLGAREPNYHSDLQTLFLYTGEGQTRRRVGGNRTTTTAARFFDEVARQTVDAIQDASTGTRLYELGTPFGHASGLTKRGLAVSLDTFAAYFRHGQASLEERLSLCKTRAISGRPETRTAVDELLRSLLVSGEWYAAMAGQIRELRLTMESSAGRDNLKRAVGGTVDVELATQALQLRHARNHPEILVPGTLDALGRIADAGLLDPAIAAGLRENYRLLREVESKLRLLDSPARHEIPTDPLSLERLAFLMNRPNPQEIVATCRDVRAANRQLFNTVIGKLTA